MESPKKKEKKTRRAELAMLESFISCCHCHQGHSPDPGDPMRMSVSEIPGTQPSRILLVELDAAVALCRGPVLREGSSVGGSVDSTLQTSTERPDSAARSRGSRISELDLKVWKRTHLRRRRFLWRRETTEVRRKQSKQQKQKRGEPFPFLNSSVSLAIEKVKAFYLLPQWKTGVGPRPGRPALGEAWSACSGLKLTASWRDLQEEAVIHQHPSWAGQEQVKQEPKHGPEPSQICHNKNSG